MTTLYDVNLDPFAGVLEPPLNRAAAENYIRERVAVLMHKSNSKNAEVEKSLQEMASHDGPPTKEEIEKHIRLKYGPDSPSFASSTSGPMAKAATFDGAADDSALSDSLGF
jgi:hypothetical protein